MGFESAGDPRHAEVMAHMKRFLNQQFTTSILDGTFGRGRASGAKASDPQGKILEHPTSHLINDDDDDDVAPQEEKQETPTKVKPEEINDPTIQNMEDILKEAVQDMSDSGMDAKDIDNILTNPRNQPSSTETDDLAKHDDTFAELNAMFNDADAELNELLNSRY